VYPAISARGFFFLKRAFIEPPPGVIQEVAAIITQDIAGFMPAATIDTYHRLDSFLLSQHSAVFFIHSGLYIHLSPL